MSNIQKQKKIFEPEKKYFSKKQKNISKKIFKKLKKEKEKEKKNWKKITISCKLKRILRKGLKFANWKAKDWIGKWRELSEHF